MKTNINSLDNLEIRRKFLARELLCDVTLMVDFILTTNDPQGPFVLDDIENYSVSCCPECGVQCNGKCPCCGWEASSEDELEDCYQEIYEWYEVSECLYKRLCAHGQPVIEYGGGYLWGRTCTGQAAYLDDEIGLICLELGLLEKEVVA